jgi:hypothetical protein
MKIKMIKPEVHTSIVSFYDNIARRLGYNPNFVTYDCKKIDVSENIFEEIYAYYREKENIGQESMGMMWCCYGPKVKEELKDFDVDIQDGFIEEVEVCQRMN